jgi:cytidine deaminase
MKNEISKVEKGQLSIKKRQLPAQGRVKKTPARVEGEDVLKDALDDLTCRMLISEALTGMKNSYSPYSDFKVGAALMCDDRQVFKGCNLENSAFSPTICAERVAFSKALSEGKRKFCAIAIVGGKAEGDNKVLHRFTPPCGVCMQFMCEFVNPLNFFVIIAKSEDDYRIYTLNELMPIGFKLT